MIQCPATSAATVKQRQNPGAIRIFTIECRQRFLGCQWRSYYVIGVSVIRYYVWIPGIRDLRAWIGGITPLGSIEQFSLGARQRLFILDRNDRSARRLKRERELL